MLIHSADDVIPKIARCTSSDLSGDSARVGMALWLRKLWRLGIVKFCVYAVCRASQAVVLRSNVLAYSGAGCSAQLQDVLKSHAFGI